MNAEEKARAQRAQAWATMQAAAGTHSEPKPVSIKARDNAWRKNVAVRDLRTADAVFGRFNALPKQV